MLEFLTIILLFIFLDRIFYERMENYLLLIPAILLINSPIIRNLFVSLSLPLIFYCFSRSESIFIKSILFSIMTSTILAIEGNFYPFYPILRESTKRAGFLHIIDAVLIYLIVSVKKKFFVDRKILLATLVVIPIFLNLDIEILNPDELYRSFRRDLVCVYGIVKDSKKIIIDGSEVYLIKLCLKNCVFFYYKEKVSGEIIVCGYPVYKEGKVYLKKAYLR